MKTLAIVGTELRRVLRWRANIFFLLIMPMGLILLLGVAFGSSSARVGVVRAGNGPLARELASALDNQPGLDTRGFGSERALERAVERGYVSAGLVIPSDYDQRLRAGKTVGLPYLSRPDSLAQQVRVAVEAAVNEQGSLVAAARSVRAERGGSSAQALARVEAIRIPAPVRVRLLAADGGSYPVSQDQFQQSASTQLLLFVFLSALTGSVWLIETRRLGVARRMLSTPTSAREILWGTALGRWTVALLQAIVIIFFSWLVFSVNWGDPVATGTLVVVFSLVAVGAGMLIGTLFSSEQQAGPVAMIVGLVCAAIGGSMVPLEVFPSTMRTVAHVTPHAWANDAFTHLLQHGGGLTSIAVDLAVLSGFALVLLTLSGWRLRRVLTA
jgi:ABC-2 type transport system permease protein